MLEFSLSFSLCIYISRVSAHMSTHFQPAVFTFELWNNP